MQQLALIIEPAFTLMYYHVLLLSLSMSTHVQITPIFTLNTLLFVKHDKLLTHH